ncbi:queuine tRNA-ribosyltransferase [Elysia marginata]|uniref:Queuine tRNA-ribosyltransferase catalytic subunit 1 n=1 Tax=Elysia marginata TaxID=1093978 RepID=A0AAV4G7K2_9GAST|nr:queuine tRNA-ribosyltransferase [Elysia marginata]
MRFVIEAIDNITNARVATLETEHGRIHTPIFMPVGTLANIKGVHQHELANDINAEIILGNTYHLFLRPGVTTIEKAGGLHHFMNWNRAILTDSGGYQVYSLSKSRKITEEGVTFKNHINGDRHLLTPEVAIDLQRSIGADIIMAFDECIPYPCEYDYSSRAMRLTHHWLERCIKKKNSKPPLYGYQQYLFPIVQGGTYSDLRAQSARYITEKDCHGNAIGGLSVGEPAELMYEMTESVCNILPKSKPRYLMGVGTPANILECIALGVDMFDCVMPTRNARNGMLFTSQGIVNIKNKKWANDFSQIDENGVTVIDRQYSKAYLRHLFVANEMLGKQIASIHNLGFYLWLVRQARKQIIQGTFGKWKNQMVKKVSQRL